MAIYTAPVVSAPLYLGDLSATVKQLEGECDEKDRAWVVVRQAKEKDQARVSKMSSETRTIFRNADTEQITDVNPADVRAVQVYSCLMDAGNIFGKDPKQPLFRFNADGVEGGLQAFKNGFGELHPDVARAILLAVLKLNPTWDWTILRRVRCPECTNEFELTDSVLLPLGEVITQAAES